METALNELVPYAETIANSGLVDSSHFSNAWADEMARREVAQVPSLYQRTSASLAGGDPFLDHGHQIGRRLLDQKTIEKAFPGLLTHTRLSVGG